MLQNPCKTLGFKKKMVYKIPPGGGGGGKPYPASGLLSLIISPHPDPLLTLWHQKTNDFRMDVHVFNPFLPFTAIDVCFLICL